jgi:acetyl-CoA carboxylase carboxyl transferase subunit beta
VAPGDAILGSLEDIPADLWEECAACHQLLYSREFEAALWVCSKCGYHKRLTVQQRLKTVTDEGSAEELFTDLPLADPLHFPEYHEKLEQARQKTGMDEAVWTGLVSIGGHRVGMGIMDLAFVGGSMGWVVGEKLALLLERCVQDKRGAVIFCASGGARMQESLVALMQMPKTCAAVGKMNEARLPYITVLTDPTYGGVTASFAFLGDVILAEKGAAMGFAGPRVIQITKMKIAPEVQTAEFQYEHGMIDLLVSREQLRDTLVDLLEWFGPNAIGSLPSRASISPG